MQTTSVIDSTSVATSNTRHPLVCLLGGGIPNLENHNEYALVTDKTMWLFHSSTSHSQNHDTAGPPQAKTDRSRQLSKMESHTDFVAKDPCSSRYVRLVLNIKTQVPFTFQLYNLRVDPDQQPTVILNEMVATGELEKTVLCSGDKFPQLSSRHLCRVVLFQHNLVVLYSSRNNLMVRWYDLRHCSPVKPIGFREIQRYFFTLLQHEGISRDHVEDVVQNPTVHLLGNPQTLLLAFLELDYSQSFKAALPHRQVCLRMDVLKLDEPSHSLVSLCCSRSEYFTFSSDTLSFDLFLSTETRRLSRMFHFKWLQVSTRTFGIWFRSATGYSLYGWHRQRMILIKKQGPDEIHWSTVGAQMLGCLPHNTRGEIILAEPSVFSQSQTVYKFTSVLIKV